MPFKVVFSFCPTDKPNSWELEYFWRGLIARSWNVCGHKVCAQELSEVMSNVGTFIFAAGCVESGENVTNTTYVFSRNNLKR